MQAGRRRQAGRQAGRAGRQAGRQAGKLSARGEIVGCPFQQECEDIWVHV